MEGDKKMGKRAIVMDESIISHFIEMSDLEEKLNVIEEVLHKFFDDDSHVVSHIVGSIRDHGGMEDFAKGAHLDDYVTIPDPCPYCGSVDVYEKLDCNDSMDNKIGSSKKHRWLYPQSFCKCCGKYYNYGEEI